MRNRRIGAKELATLFSGIVITVTPLSLAVGGCSLGNQNQCSGTGGGPLPDPVTVTYTPPVCTAPEASVVSDASDAEAVSDAGDGSAADDASTADAGIDASFDAGPPVCDDYLICQRLCPQGFQDGDCVRGLNDAGVDSVTCFPMKTAHCGRRFAGLREPSHAGATALGAFLAGSAYLEEASITSFEILAEELAVHGAPAALVSGARRSARDEVRHARTMTALAKRHGANVRTVRARRRSVRPLEQVIRENAIEGCIRETYGALQATFQAAHASCPKIRAAMKVIALDETRHAALAWKIDAWATSRLTAEEQAELARARRRAVQKLRRDLEATSHPSLVREAGVPTPMQAGALLRELSRGLGLAA